MRFHVHATLIYYTYIHYIYICVCARVCLYMKAILCESMMTMTMGLAIHGQDTNLEVSITGGLMSSSSSSSLGSLTKTLGAAATPSDEPKVGNLEIMGNDNLSDPNQIHQIQRFWSLFFGYLYRAVQACSTPGPTEWRARRHYHANSSRRHYHANSSRRVGSSCIGCTAARGYFFGATCWGDIRSVWKLRGCL